jgi:hypothetical protein
MEDEQTEIASENILESSLGNQISTIMITIHSGIFYFFRQTQEVLPPSGTIPNQITSQLPTGNHP